MFFAKKCVFYRFLKINRAVFGFECCRYSVIGIAFWGSDTENILSEQKQVGQSQPVFLFILKSTPITAGIAISCKMIPGSAFAKDPATNISIV